MENHHYLVLLELQKPEITKKFLAELLQKNTQTLKELEYTPLHILAFLKDLRETQITKYNETRRRIEQIEGR